jgi:hypothetical protein
MQGMNNRLKKIIASGMALYLAVLFAIIVPNHHHEDHAEHTDCIICFIAHQPTQVSVTFALALVAILLIAKLVLPAAILVFQIPVSLQSRAPPLYNLFKQQFLV